MEKTKRVMLGEDIRKKVLKKTDGKCFYCGKKLTLEELSVDHIYPLNLGGSNQIENLIPSCEKCNQNKGSDFLYKHLLMLENLVQKQSNIINGKHDIINKIWALVEDESRMRKRNDELKRRERENNRLRDDSNKKQQEINALKNERAKLLKDINEMRKNTVEKKEYDKVCNNLQNTKIMLKNSQDEYSKLLNENKDLKSKKIFKEIQKTTDDERIKGLVETVNIKEKIIREKNSIIKKQSKELKRYEQKENAINVKVMQKKNKAIIENIRNSKKNPGQFIGKKMKNWY